MEELWSHGLKKLLWKNSEANCFLAFYKHCTKFNEPKWNAILPVRNKSLKTENLLIHINF